MEQGISACGSKQVTSAPAAYPSVLLVESMAQLAGIAAGDEENTGAYLATIDRAEFFGPVLPGDTLTVTVRIIKSFGRLHLVEGTAVIDERIAATATLTLAVGTL